MAFSFAQTASAGTDAVARVRGSLGRGHTLSLRRPSHPVLSHVMMTKPCPRLEGLSGGVAPCALGTGARLRASVMVLQPSAPGPSPGVTGPLGWVSGDGGRTWGGLPGTHTRQAPGLGLTLALRVLTQDPSRRSRLRSQSTLGARSVTAPGLRRVPLADPVARVSGN